MKRSIISLISFAFVGSLVGRIFRFLLNVIVARGLGAEALGVFAFGMVVMKGLGTISRLGLDTAARKFVPIYLNEDDDQGLLGLVILSSAIPALAGSMLAILAYYIFNNVESYISPSLYSYLPLFLLGIPLFAVMMISGSTTQGYQETKYWVYSREIGQSGSAFLLGLVSVYLLRSVESTIVVYLLSFLIATVLAIWFTISRKEFQWRVTPRFDARKIFTFSLPLALVAGANYLLTWTDILMLGMFVPSAKVGWYQAAYQTSVMLLIVLSAANSLFPSMASHFMENDRMDRLETVYTSITKWLFSLSLLGFAYLFLYSSPVLSLFAVSNSPAQQSLIVLAFSQFIAAATGPAGVLLAISRHERLKLLNTVVALVLNVGLNFVLIQSHGIVGAAIATAISRSLINIARVAEISYLVGLSPFTKGYWKNGIGVLVSIVVMNALTNLNVPAIPHALGSGFIGLCVFIGALWLLGFDSEDRTLFQSID